MPTERDVEVERGRRHAGPGRLEAWIDAARAVRAALERDRADLERHRSPRQLIDRIRDRLDDLLLRARTFDPKADLRECSDSWKKLGDDVTRLSGPGRDRLLRLLEQRRSSIERDAPKPAAPLGDVVHDARTGRAGERFTVAGRREPGQRKQPRLCAERELSDPAAAQMRGHVARIDSLLVRLRGAHGAELSRGVREVGAVLGAMADLACSPAAARHLASFRKLVAERRSALARLAADASRPHGAEALHRPGLLAQPSHLAAGERQIDALRKLHPGLDRLLRTSSSSHLARALPHPPPSLTLPLPPAPAANLAMPLPPVPPANAGLAMPLPPVPPPSAGLVLPLPPPNAAGALPRPPLPPTTPSVGLPLSPVPAMNPGLVLPLPPAPPPDSRQGQPAATSPRASSAAGAIAGSLADLLPAAVPTAVGSLQIAASAQRSAPVAVAAVAARAPLHAIASARDDKQRLLLAKLRLERPRPEPADRMAAVASALEAKGRKDLAAHARPGGTLHAAVQSAHRRPGLALAASHPMRARRADLYTAAVFHSLLAQGHAPRLFSLSGAFHSVTHALSSAAGEAKQAAVATTGAVRSGLSDLSQAARAPASGLASVFSRGASLLKRGATSGAQRLWQAASNEARQLESGAGQLAHAAQGAYGRATSAISDLAHRGGAAASWALQRAGGAAHSGLEWLHKTGVAGGIGRGLRGGVSLLKQAARATPLGLVASGVSAAGGLKSIWERTKHAAAATWGGVKSAAHATSHFLQSPAGQLLTTGLSLAATFIPGGIVVKALVGGAIGALQAISEGKDWKGVLLGAGAGALTGALPLMKLGPLARMGMGALTGAVTTLSQGGSVKEALAAGASGTIDAFDPGALKALSRFKALGAAGKLLRGGKLSQLERAAVAGSKLRGPIHALEKAMARPGVRRSVQALEKVASKGIRGGIWVSGKAAKVQGGLDKALALGDRIEGGLALLHDSAPQLGALAGDNALGHALELAGSLAGAGDSRLKKALDYGHSASSGLAKARSGLDKVLVFAGVNDPHKAYEAMQARKAAASGKQSGIEAVALDKLAKHRAKHPELHPAHGEPARSPHEEFLRATGRAKPLPPPPPPRPPATALEKALARGGKLKKGVLEVAQGVHDKLERIHGWTQKGAGYAEKAEHGLDKLAKVAAQASGALGAHSELGAWLKEVSERAERAHAALEPAVEASKDFNERLEHVVHGIGAVPGVQKEAQHAPEAHDGKAHGKAQHPEQPKQPAETEAQRTERLRRAHERISSLARRVQKLDADAGLRRARELSAKGASREAANELTSLGMRVEEVSAAIGEAKTLSRGNATYEGEVRFYEEWHAKTRARVHAAIAGTKGLGEQTQISGFGISEATHPDVFENTRAIFAVQAKVTAFGTGLGAADARPHVEKLLGEARAAKAQLQVLQRKYAKDHAAHAFLTDGGTQDRLIDQSIGKIEAALQAEAAARVAAEPRKPGVRGKIEGALAVIERMKKAAQAAGHKPDPRLHEAQAKLEHGKAGAHEADEGSSIVSRLLHGLGDVFGEGSQPAHAPADEKVHRAIHGASEGQHQGRELIHHALEEAAEHHAATQVSSAESRRAEAASAPRAGHEPAPELLTHDAGPRAAAAPAEVVARGRAEREAVPHETRDLAPGEPEAPASEPSPGGGAEPGRASAGGERDRASAGGERGRASASESAHDLVDGVLDAIDGRVHADRHAARGGEDGRDEQDVDAAAIDTWIGSGEGAKPFTETFAAFLPAEGAPAGPGHPRRRVRARSRRGFLGDVADRLHAFASGPLFRASRSGDDVGGTLRPEDAPLGSSFDEPRRLDAATLSRMEQFLGGDFAGVRIHTGPGAADVTRRYDAEAVTVKDHIFFAPGRFNPETAEGQRLLAHELTHVLQKNRKNLDVRTAETEAIQAERTFGQGPAMETLNLSRPQPDFKLADGEGLGAATGIHTAKRTRSRGFEAGGKDEIPDGEEFLEKVSDRVYTLLMDELEQSFESR